MNHSATRSLALCLLALFATVGIANAQSLDDLNIQIHGYATQGFLYTTQNNVFTTHSNDGSPSWTEAVVNVTAQPEPKLRVGVQARYFVLGNFGNSITLDWAMADYKYSDVIGVRFGKVKTPVGLFNEIQDIDPSYMWSLLPQSVYFITSRNSLLAHVGGVVYGKFKLGEKGGKLEYRGFGGEQTIGAQDGYTINQREAGVDTPNGLSFVIQGGTLRWLTPVNGLMIGASDLHHNDTSAQVTTDAGQATGTQSIKEFHQFFYFGKYEHGKYFFAGEYTRTPVAGAIVFPDLFTQPVSIDTRAWYAMASYKLSNKLTAGIYNSQNFDHKAALGPARYSKDWTVSARYDFSGFLYAKAEQHFIDGTSQNYDSQLNPNGLKPDTRLTVLKVGVSF